MHVIEGMSPMFMGLALGKNSPGADPTRPVVRVVYQDSQGRLIFLDQQRIRPGQSTQRAGSRAPLERRARSRCTWAARWDADILRNYRGRVR